MNQMRQTIPVVLYLKKYWQDIILILLLSVFTSMISAVTPFINRFMLDHGLFLLDIRNTVIGAVLLLFFAALGAVIEYMGSKAEYAMCRKIGIDLKKDAFSHAMKLKASYYKEQGVFQVVRNATYDIECVLNIIEGYLLKVFLYIMTAVGTVIGLFILDWKLSLFILLLLPLRIAVNMQFGKIEQACAKECQRQEQHFNSWFHDFVNGMIDIKMWGLESRKVNEYEDILKDTTKAQQEALLISSKSSLSFSIITSLSTNLLYIIGITQIIHSQLTLGELISFIGFSSYFFSPVTIILDTVRMMKRILPNLDSLKEFYAMEEESSEHTLPLTEPIDTISFRDVSISLKQRMILQKVSFDLYRGDKVLILGENGSGKSTLLNLLLRIYDPNEGKIFINGVPIDDFDIGSYRSHFSVVSQDIYLFSGSIEDNIDLDSRNGKRHLVNFCDKSIQQLKDGYQTKVGSNGSMISGGERQKVALLRALNRKSDILVLDEPTSNYDAVSEEQFNQFIAQNTDYGFYIIIAHHKKLVEHVDVIIQVRDQQVEIFRNRRG
ncbi:MAG: ABC transporter ATP-binding protein [Eubacteriales bacterium]|nr:ABC transporter ATP-binding protein [Eubacteriales bacterium]